MPLMEVIGFLVLVAILGFIFYGLVVPGIIAPFWEWASKIPITPYPNLNGCVVSIGILAIIIGILVVPGILSKSKDDDIVEVVEKARKFWHGATCLVIVIAMLLVIVIFTITLIGNSISWLFAR